MSRRAVLWIAFAVVHVGVAVLGFLLPNQPMGDVTNVYEPWSRRALEGHGIVGITAPWVYPQLALLPMVIAQGLAWIAGYLVAWALLVTACDALAFAVLIGRATSTGRWLGGWYWLVFIAVLGPVGMYRLDGLTVALAIAGSLWLIGRPWLGSALLAAATWIKVWPAALVVAALIAVRRRLAVFASGAVVSAAIVAVVVAAGGAANLLGFVTDQTDRGLQLEAPVSTFYLWRAVAGIPGSFIYYDRDLLTFQVTGPEVDALIALMTPLLAIAVLAVAAVGGYKAWRGAAFVSLYPNLGLGLVLAFIVFNKVGSPQYVTWIIAPLVVGLVIDRRRWWKPAVLGLAIAGLTFAVYPMTYRGLLLAEAGPGALLTIRNLLLAVMLAWIVARLVRVPVRTTVRAAQL
ncbi:glycosyltransferase 87 family protein [Microbacterium sp. SS28]|uniref:glycosyltransferase 87 family protein n=1 Tax=Microbacterium sp. SS28 TaxID=2919948 RepID=UPI001FA94A15|nr:glycosyltransferase 87 family protein [Microbacterium sp. SS28]